MVLRVLNQGESVTETFVLSITLVFWLQDEDKDEMVEEMAMKKKRQPTMLGRGSIQIASIC